MTGTDMSSHSIIRNKVLEVEDLRTSFRIHGEWQEVVKGISFSIGVAETVALVGESGSGKSVTALSLMGLLDREATRLKGRVMLDGQSLLDMPQRDMRMVRGRKIGMVFQEAMTSLNPLVPVGKQIAEVLQIHRIASGAQAEAQAVQLLDRVRIPAARQRAKSLPSGLSGGMRQRVMIAMALACKPQMLIADEPTTALDVTIQAQILNLIKELQNEEQMGVLFITHDMGVVAEIADRTLVMLGGEVVEQGDTESIFLDAKHIYTKGLIAAVPRLGSQKGRSGPQHFPVVDRQSGRLIEQKNRPDTVDTKAQPVLKVENLVKYFEISGGFLGKVTGRVHAVENVSFELLPGETLSLVGESGCGKSTTGRAVMHLIEPNAGNTSVSGLTFPRSDQAKIRQWRQNIQMVFQDPYASLNPRIRVGDAIAEPLIIHQVASKQDARAIARDLLVQVGLSADDEEKFPQHFSGGQRQRICIARALALSPKVIIADECVSGLDVSVKAQVVNLLLDLQQRLGLSMIFISHDMAVVEKVSHRVAVMYLGEIVEIGPAAAVFSNPQHPYTKRLLAAVPAPDPSRRRKITPLDDFELKSPIRSATYVPPARKYTDVGGKHIVQEWGTEWA